MSRRTGLLAAVGALLSGCSAVEVLNTLVPSGTYVGREAVAYGADPRHRLDVYQPREAAPGAPVVLFFYGGSWSSGSRSDYRFVGEALAANGIVALVADYRLSPAVRWRDILADCAAATRWTFDNAASLGGDPRRIHLMGHSAGAYNAAMLALDARWLQREALVPQRLAGWIGLAGPYDFLPIGDPQTRVAFDWPNTPPESQPIQHVAALAPRALLMAAAADTVVNPQRSTVGLANRLMQVGVPVQLKLFDRVNHATLLGAVARPLSWLAPVLPEVVGFVGSAGQG